MDNSKPSRPISRAPLAQDEEMQEICQTRDISTILATVSREKRPTTSPLKRFLKLPQEEEEKEEEEEEEPKMMALGNHKSLEEPPILPFFGSQTKKKQSQQDRLAETSGASMGASMATMRNDSSSNDDRRGKLLEQLKELKNLLDSDVLSRKEYDDQKSIVLQNLKDL